MRTRGGFTFVELFLVVIVIGIATALSIPRLKKNLENIALESFVKDVYYLSRYVQSTSVAQGKIYCLNLDPGIAAFWVSVKDDDRYVRVGGRFGRIMRAPKGVDVSLVPLDAYAVYFYPDSSTDKVDVVFEGQGVPKIYLVFEGASGGIKVKE